MSREKKRLGRGLAALLGDLNEAAQPAAQAAPQPAAEPATAHVPGDEIVEPPGPRLHEPEQSEPDAAAPSQSPAQEHNESPPQEAASAAAAANSAAPQTANDTLLLDVYEIDDNPFQPRREFSESEIAALAESLKTHDQLQPILVRRMGARYQLISGERRLRAAIHAGWQQVKAQVREADDRLVAELAIVENLQRKDLNAIEKAASFHRYLETHGCTQEELAGRLKIDRSTIANLVRLLELPAPVQDAVRSGELTAGHARALLPLGDEPEQLAFAGRVVSESLSVRATERLVQEHIQAADADPLADAGKPGVDRAAARQISQLEEEFRVALGAKVEIRQTARGKGRIIVHFKNVDDFERLREHLCQDWPQSKAG